MILWVQAISILFEKMKVRTVLVVKKIKPKELV